MELKTYTIDVGHNVVRELEIKITEEEFTTHLLPLYRKMANDLVTTPKKYPRKKGSAVTSYDFKGLVKIINSPGFDLSGLFLVEAYITLEKLNKYLKKNSIQSDFITYFFKEVSKSDLYTFNDFNFKRCPHWATIIKKETKTYQELLVA